MRRKPRRRLPPKTARQKSKQRARSEAGRWPVASPVPFVIDLLRRVSFFHDAAVMPGAARNALIGEAREIVAAWDARESLPELRTLLGVKQHARRKQSTVNREEDLAFAAAEHKARGTLDPIGTVADEAGVSERTVQRAVENWPHVEKVVRIARTYFGAEMEIDYSAFKKK